MRAGPPANWSGRSTRFCALYLPSEKELAVELLKERRAIEMKASLAGKARKTKTR
jgi:hypothetical protein